MPVLVPVIGMHRSGTSATAGALARCGIYFGPAAKLMPASPANPRGHWENLEVVALHDWLLRALGGRWDRPLIPDVFWTLKSDVARVAVSKATRWLHSLEGPDPFGVKDPRMTLFYAIWQQAAERAGFELRPVIVTRDMSAVRASLEARDGLMSDLAFNSMAQSYRAGADAWTAARPFATIRFRDLVDHPAGELHRVLHQIELTPPPSFAKAEAFLDGSLIHA